MIYESVDRPNAEFINVGMNSLQFTVYSINRSKQSIMLGDDAAKVPAWTEGLSIPSHSLLILQAAQHLGRFRFWRVQTVLSIRVHSNELSCFCTQLQNHNTQRSRDLFTLSRAMRLYKLSCQPSVSTLTTLLMSLTLVRTELLLFGSKTAMENGGHSNFPLMSPFCGKLTFEIF